MVAHNTCADCACGWLVGPLQARACIRDRGGIYPHLQETWTCPVEPRRTVGTRWCWKIWGSDTTTEAPGTLGPGQGITEHTGWRGVNEDIVTALRVCTVVLENDRVVCGAFLCEGDNRVGTVIEPAKSRWVGRAITVGCRLARIVIATPLGKVRRVDPSIRCAVEFYCGTTGDVRGLRKGIVQRGEGCLERPITCCGRACRCVCVDMDDIRGCRCRNGCGNCDCHRGCRGRGRRRGLRRCCRWGRGLIKSDGARAQECVAIIVGWDRCECCSASLCRSIGACEVESRRSECRSIHHRRGGPPLIGISALGSKPLSCVAATDKGTKLTPCQGAWAGGCGKVGRESRVLWVRRKHPASAEGINWTGCGRGTSPLIFCKYIAASRVQHDIVLPHSLVTGTRVICPHRGITSLIGAEDIVDELTATAVCVEHDGASLVHPERIVVRLDVVCTCILVDALSSPIDNVVFERDIANTVVEREIGVTDWVVHDVFLVGTPDGTNGITLACPDSPRIDVVFSIAIDGVARQVHVF